jgi:hypothetical protein
MEEWNIGIMEEWNIGFLFYPVFHHSIIPSFQTSPF